MTDVASENRAAKSARAFHRRALRKGEIVKARGYGTANVEHGVPATERNDFTIWFCW